MTACDSFIVSISKYHWQTEIVVTLPAHDFFLTQRPKLEISIKMLRRGGNGRPSSFIPDLKGKPVFAVKSDAGCGFITLGNLILSLLF